MEIHADAGARVYKPGFPPIPEPAAMQRDTADLAPSLPVQPISPLDGRYRAAV